MIHLPKLVLASGSPRRAEILTAVGWEFEKRVADVDESVLPDEDPGRYVVRLAREKAEAGPRAPGEIVLGADTTVVINGSIIGKPADIDEARSMIRMLAGNRHEVLTGIAVVDDRSTRMDKQCTDVKFAPMTDDEIEYLVQNGDPLDKAGAYA